MFAAQLRRRQLQRQIPLHDLHAKFCASLTDNEMHKFQKFVSKRKHKSAGVGVIKDLPKDSQFVSKNQPKRLENIDLKILIANSAVPIT